MWQIVWLTKEKWKGELDLTNVDLADILHMREGTIGNMMNNELDRISLQELAALCELLQCEITDVLLLIKDSEPMTKEERDANIMRLVGEVRKERTQRSAEKRQLSAEKKRIEEEQRILDIVQRVLAAHGYITPEEWQGKN